MLKFGFQNRRASEIVNTYNLSITDFTVFNEIVKGVNGQIKLNIVSRTCNPNLLNPYYTNIKNLAGVAAICYELIENPILRIPRDLNRKINGNYIVNTIDYERRRSVYDYQLIAQSCEREIEVLKRKQLERLEKILKELD